MMRIKVTTPFPYHPLVRQTPGWSGRFGGCRFFVDDESVTACDAWVVVTGLRSAQRVTCPAGNTVYVDCEPPEVHQRPRAFLDQFASVITCQAQVEHAGKRLGHLGLPWHAGINRVSDEAVLDYDALSAMTRIDKPGLISVVCSSRASTPGHRLRLAFLERLRAHFGDRLAVFGRGVRPIGDKWQAVAPYRYHIALENSRVPHYFSEKLTDAYLGGAYPFYYGCPNLDAYFPAGAYTAIDIRDPAGAIASIETAMAADAYGSAREAVWAARRLVLDRYNLFAVLAETCRTLVGGRRRAVTVFPEAAMAGAALSSRLKLAARRVLAPLRRAA